MTSSGGHFVEPFISVVIPAFNEENCIGDVLVRLRNTMEAWSSPHEVIVVDDGSTDDTKKIAAENKAVVLRNETNQGKGFALSQGFTHAKGNIIVTMDADGSHDPKYIKKLILPILNGADMVMGCRFSADQGKNSTKRLHALGKLLINMLIFIVTGVHVSDSQTGFRAFKKEALQNIAVTSKGYQVETEITVKCLKNGIVTKEVPIFTNSRMSGYSRIKPFSDGLKILKVILVSSINSQAHTRLNGARDRIDLMRARASLESRDLGAC